MDLEFGNLFINRKTLEHSFNNNITARCELAKDTKFFFDLLKERKKKLNNQIKKNKINEDDDEVNKMFAESGSDLSDSEYSIADSLEKGNDYHSINGTVHQYKRLNYNDVETTINKYYLDLGHRYSSSLDILASYLKGQKTIYQ